MSKGAGVLVVSDADQARIEPVHGRKRRLAAPCGCAVVNVVRGDPDLLVAHGHAAGAAV
jgi:hypothetical protein